jgi:nucleoside transporter
MAHGGTPAATAPRLRLGLRLNLSVMMFLQFAVWGAWFVVLGVYMEKGLHFDGARRGWIYGTMALGTIFAPMFIGQVADRYFASEKLMALLHLAGAGLLFWMSQITDVNLFFTAALTYALVYSPTLVLSNAITFAHVPDGARDFPSIRVLGTIGWIVANLIVGSVLPLFFSHPDETNAPLLLAAAFSAVLGLSSFLLPHTPPAGKTGDAFPALRAVGLLRDPSFAVFFGVSFVITIVLAFYYGFTGNYLADSTLPALPEAQKHLALTLGGRSFTLDLTVATVMTIGQVAEMVLLPLLPWFLRRLGMKWVLALGMLSWGVRYYLFSLGAVGMVGPWVVIASLALHGLCFDFFFAAGFIYVDNEAPNEIRASGQALFTFLTYGLGMWLGNVVSGYVVDYFNLGTKGTPVYDWYMIWTIPSVGVLIALAIFIVFFRIRPRAKEPVGLHTPPGDRPLSSEDPGSTDVYAAEYREGISSGQGRG